MKNAMLISLVAATLSTGTALAGDVVAGKQKATACAVCHGNETFGGIFYTLQLAGRDADKLATKTNKYKTGKILHPMMNLATAFYTEKEIEDISAYYKSLGKPALNLPYVKIKGDDDVDTAVTVNPPAAYGKVASGY
jgi:cytochrome c553